MDEVEAETGAEDGGDGGDWAGAEVGAEAGEAVGGGDGGLSVRSKELQNDLIENHTSTRNKCNKCGNIWTIF